MSDSSLETVREIGSDVFATPLNVLDPDSSPNTIGAWDSVQHVSFVIALEQHFGIEFRPEEFDRMVSIRAIAALVDAKLGDK